MIKQICIVLVSLFLFVACTPEEGKGGKATITGKIFVKDYNKEGLLKDEYFAGEYAVYIVYGEETLFGDDTKTHSDGSFAFEYLYAGKYTVFAYSKCLECPGERDTVSMTVELEKGQVLDIATLEVRD